MFVHSAVAAVLAAAPHSAVAAVMAAPPPAPTLNINTDMLVGAFIKYVLPLACLVIGATIIFGHKKRRMADNAETTAHLVWGMVIILAAPAIYFLGDALVGSIFKTA